MVEFNQAFENLRRIHILPPELLFDEILLVELNMINGVRWLLGDHNPTGRPYPIVPKLTFETELKNEVFFMNKGKYLE